MKNNDETTNLPNETTNLAGETTNLPNDTITSPNDQPSAQTQSEEDRSLFAQFRHMQWLMSCHHMHNHRKHGPMGDPHRGQGRVLSLLKLKHEISQKELTYLLDMRPQSLGELLGKLERGGYITRTPSEADRRVMNIQLTEQGKAVPMGDGQKCGADDVFACLDDQERATLSGYLERILSTLEEKLSAEGAMDERGTPYGEGPNGRRGRGRCDFGPHGPRDFGAHGPRDFGAHGPRDFGPHGPRGMNGPRDRCDDPRFGRGGRFQYGRQPEGRPDPQTEE